MACCRLPVARDQIQLDKPSRYGIGRFPFGVAENLFVSRSRFWIAVPVKKFRISNLRCRIGCRCF